MTREDDTENYIIKKLKETPKPKTPKPKPQTL